MEIIKNEDLIINCLCATCRKKYDLLQGFYFCSLCVKILEPNN